MIHHEAEAVSGYFFKKNPQEFKNRWGRARTGKLDWPWLVVHFNGKIMLNYQDIRVVQLFMRAPSRLFCSQFEGRKYCEHDFQMLFAPCCGECGKMWSMSTLWGNSYRAVQTSHHCSDIQPWAGIVDVILRSNSFGQKQSMILAMIWGSSGCGNNWGFFKVRL